MREAVRTEHQLRNVTADLKWAALISVVLVLPFAILEYLNRTVNQQSASSAIVLFGVLWLLPMAFVFILAPIVRHLRTGNSVMAHPFNLLFRIVCLSAIAMFWGRLIIDQMPCFLGVPNCD